MSRYTVIKCEGGDRRGAREERVRGPRTFYYADLSLTCMGSTLRSCISSLRESNTMPQNLDNAYLVDISYFFYIYNMYEFNLPDFFFPKLLDIGSIGSLESLTA